MVQASEHSWWYPMAVLQQCNISNNNSNENNNNYRVSHATVEHSVYSFFYFCVEITYRFASPIYQQFISSFTFTNFDFAILKMKISLAISFSWIHLKKIPLKEKQTKDKLEFE
ncbi:GL20978 [Drosophila persimilis]|uniref:GL20978 n=1 Tax=Drosophila persimilis TaxID=7234 RepID=B4IS05_DROPE|nr:GL20978 [Drosophila persimilis]